MGGWRRVPRDRTLAQWIRELEARGKLWEFYQTLEWRRLRAEVIAEFHNQCTDCLAKSPAVLTRPTTVHHVREVKDRPDLALSKSYRDADGSMKRQLVPLCDECHNARHGRFHGAKPKPQLNDERW